MKNFILFIVISSIFIGCGGEEAAPKVKTFTIGGTVSNLGASEILSLKNNGGDKLRIDDNGDFEFDVKIADGDDYKVTISSQPDRQTCTVSNGSGTVSGENITDVEIECVTTKPIIFRTQDNHDGNYGGIAGADEVCMNDPNTPVAGTYKAFLSQDGVRRACSTANCSGGSEENIDWVLKPDTTYYRADGTTTIMTTNDAAIFVFGTFDNSIVVAAVDHWTGLNTDWTPNSNDCANWTDGTIGQSGIGGQGQVTTTAAIQQFSAGCNDPAVSLLCVEQ